jgi:hypothetical protein
MAELEPFLASVRVDFRGAQAMGRGRIADAFMAVEDVVTVKVPGDGATAEYRVDVWERTRESASRHATEPADLVAAALELEHLVVGVKLQTEAERLAALQTAAGYGPFGFTGRA